MADDASSMRLLSDIPRVSSRERPHSTAVSFGQRSLSFSELDRRSDRVAHRLLSEGVRPGDRIAFLAKDSDRSVVALFGCVKARGVALGINWRLTAQEIAFILEDSGAQVLFTTAELAAKTRAGTTAPMRVIALDGGTDWPELDVWCEGAPAVPLPEPTSEDEVAVQMYTSGTTGRPKGVQLAHRSFFAIVRAMREAGDPWIGLSSSDVSLVALPAFHIGGLWWLATGLAAGAPQVIMSAFHPSEAIRLLTEKRVTKTCLVPAMIQALLMEPSLSRSDLSRLDHIVHGGSPMPPALMARARESFPSRFVQIYGLTETGNTAVCLRPEDWTEAPERAHATGRPYPTVQIRCVGPDGADLPPRAPGEIWIRSPANMIGYWNRPDETSQILVDGWVRTGDAGWIDEGGFVYVTDRLKDLIISGGEHVYPAEIEAALLEHPSVLEAAVIGIPDDRWGELVKALVVLRPEASVPASKLAAHLRGRIADFKMPRSIDFVDALPRTPSGKVQKAALRAPYWEGRERQI